IEIEKSETTTKVSGKEHVETVVEAESMDMKLRYSPAVLKMSQEHSIDLTKVKGTGKGGRITRKDVQLFLDTKEVNPVSEQSTVNEAVPKPVQIKEAGPASQEIVRNEDGDLEIPVLGIRNAIATKMVRSKQEIPHAW